MILIGKYYETNTLFPNTDWYAQGNIIIDENTDEGKAIAEKIKKHSPYFDFVFDSEGKIIDIIPTERPLEQPSKEEINQQVVTKIRERYSIDDEFHMQRLGLQDSTDAEYQAYLIYVNECVNWGTVEKDRLGLI